MVQTPPRQVRTGVSRAPAIQVCAGFSNDGRDAMAQERKCILDKKRINQSNVRKLDDSYRRTNVSLKNCPCPRLS